MEGSKSSNGASKSKQQANQQPQCAMGDICEMIRLNYAEKNRTTRLSTLQVTVGTKNAIKKCFNVDEAVLNSKLGQSICNCCYHKLRKWRKTGTKKEGINGGISTKATRSKSRSTSDKQAAANDDLDTNGTTDDANVASNDEEEDSNNDSKVQLLLSLLENTPEEAKGSKNSNVNDIDGSGSENMQPRAQVASTPERQLRRSARTKTKSRLLKMEDDFIIDMNTGTPKNNKRRYSEQIESKKPPPRSKRQRASNSSAIENNDDHDDSFETGALTSRKYNGNQPDPRLGKNHAEEIFEEEYYMEDENNLLDNKVARASIKAEHDPHGYKEDGQIFAQANRRGSKPAPPKSRVSNIHSNNNHTHKPTTPTHIKNNITQTKPNSNGHVRSSARIRNANVDDHEDAMNESGHVNDSDIEYSANSDNNSDSDYVDNSEAKNMNSVARHNSNIISRSRNARMPQQQINNNSSSNNKSTAYATEPVPLARDHTGVKSQSQTSAKNGYASLPILTNHSDDFVTFTLILDDNEPSRKTGLYEFEEPQLTMRKEMKISELMSYIKRTLCLRESIQLQIFLEGHVLNMETTLENAVYRCYGTYVDFDREFRFTYRSKPNPPKQF